MGTGSGVFTEVSLISFDTALAGACIVVGCAIRDNILSISSCCPISYSPGVRYSI